jgi:chitin disaccharide deacetylase
MVQPTSIIINADDFGMSSEVNSAILSAFEQRLCSSTTMLVNLPGFEEACELAHERRIADRIGLHLNLGEGFPVTEALRSARTFCTANGEFALSSSRALWTLTKVEAELLADEIRAQIARCRKHHIPISHLDSHRHLHVQWPVLLVLLEIARNEKIAYVRMPRNCGPGIAWYKRIYKNLVAGRIRKAGMCRTDYFGSVADYLWLKNAKQAGGSMEVMVHPRYVGDELCDYVSEFPLRRQVEHIDSYRIATSFAAN